MERLRILTLRALPILGHAHFLKLWASQILNQSAGHILNFALAIRIYDISGSTALVGVLVATISVPPVLFSSLAGALADRFDRKSILLMSNVSRALVVILFFLFGDTPAALIILGFIISAISQFFGPAESSSIPEVVEKKEIFTANAMFVSTVYITFLLGYSLAGPLLAIFGSTKVYALLFFAFILSAVLNAFMPSLRGHLERQMPLKDFLKVLKSELVDGLNFIRHHPRVITLVTQFSLVFGIERSIVALIPALAKDSLGFDVQQISLYLITPAGVGAAIGALLGNVMKHRFSKPTLVITGIVAAGLTLCLFPVLFYIGDPSVPVVNDLPQLWFVMGLVFLTGLADVLIIVASQTTFHEVTPNHTRGRVFGSLITIMNLVGLPMILIVTWLGGHFPIPDVMLALGIIMVGIGIVSMVREKTLRHL